VQLMKAFGWAILLFEDLTPRYIGKMNAFDELMQGVENRVPIYTRIKEQIDRRISPEAAKQFIIRVVSDVSGDVSFARTVIDNIDRL